MACSIPSRLAFFLFVSSLLSLSCVTASDTVNTVCKKTSNPDFCSAALRSNPRSATANLTELGLIAIDLTTSNVTTTLSKIETLEKQATDPGLKKHLDYCIFVYGFALRFWVPATVKDNFKHGAYKALLITGGLVAESASKCENGFKFVKPFSSSPVTTNNRDVELFVDIVKVIVTDLEQINLIA